MDIEKYNDHISQGVALMAQANYPAAKNEFEKAIAINIQSYEAYIHLGNACANLGLLDEAIAAFKNALVVDPASGETLYSIGNIYLLKDERLKAVEYYNKADESGFNRTELYQILAAVFFEANDSAQALRYITRAIAVSPFNGELRLFKANVYLAEKKYEQAIETLDEMQKILPDAFEAYDLRAQIYCGLKKFDEALKVCQIGCERFPDDANLALSKLKVLVEMNDDEVAEKLLEDMKSRNQYASVIKEAAIQHSIILLRKQDVDTALAVLLEANDVLENDADILYLVLDIYAQTENYEKLIEYSPVMLSVDAGPFYESTAKYFYAHALDKVGRVDEAKVEYKKLTSELRKVTIETPSFYEGYIYRLLSHTRIGEYDKALELADYLENMYPERTDANAFRYFIYKEKGDLDSAEEQKNLALAKNPDIKL